MLLLDFTNEIDVGIAYSSLRMGNAVSGERWIVLDTPKQQRKQRGRDGVRKKWIRSNVVWLRWMTRGEQEN